MINDVIMTNDWLIINDDYFRLELTISVSTYLHFVIFSCYANEYQLL